MNNKHFQMQHCHNISTISQSANNRLVFLRLDGIRLQNQQIYKNRTKTIIDNEQSIFILRYYTQN